MPGLRRARECLAKSFVVIVRVDGIPKLFRKSEQKEN